LSITKEALIGLGLTVIFVLALFCGHFGIGVSDGITIGSALPSSGWDVVTTGITWLGSALTFHLEAVGDILSWVIWILIVITLFVPLIIIIRGD
jgi:hypothetical protein